MIRTDTLMNHAGVANRLQARLLVDRHGGIWKRRKLRQDRQQEAGRMRAVVQDGHDAWRRMRVVPVARRARLGDPDPIAFHRPRDDQRQLVTGAEHVAQGRDLDLVLRRFVGRYRLEGRVRMVRPDQLFVPVAFDCQAWPIRIGGTDLRGVRRPGSAPATSGRPAARAASARGCPASGRAPGVPRRSTGRPRRRALGRRSAATPEPNGPSKR